jgi:hypothetical protein
MSTFEICFLTFVVAAFVAFAASLIIVDYRSRQP